MHKEHLRFQRPGASTLRTLKEPNNSKPQLSLKAHTLPQPACSSVVTFDHGVGQDQEASRIRRPKGGKVALIGLLIPQPTLGKSLGFGV